MSDLSTGFRKIVEFGRHKYGPMDLPGDQTYYAAAQAIDNSYVGSAFGPEISFYVPPKPIFKLLSAPTLSFGNQYIGYDSAPQTISITNTGTAPLLIVGLTHALNGSPFRVAQNNLPYSVAVGDTLQLAVVFSPTNTSAVADTIALSYNGAYYNKQYIKLSGTGIYTPPSVAQNLRVNMQGNNAVLSWSPVHTTILGAPIAGDRYIVIFSEKPDETEQNFYYLWSTADTTFVHTNVARFRKQMFYKVKTVKFYDRDQELGFNRILARKEDVSWKEILNYLERSRSLK